MAQPSGYSGKPLWQKLGLASGQRLKLIAPPAHVDDLLAGAPAGIVMSTRDATFDVALVFANDRRTLATALPALDAQLPDTGMLWIAWPKKSSGVSTDITEDVVRTEVLPLGLVDVKVCAIDATWSGLKIVRRRSARK